ncbi:MAG: DUF1707 domain-containing protein [Gemmatimonadetes bacterium]|nr:DUF1707 domain-containing protein [Gemmatimonadota bacterium]
MPDSNAPPPPAPEARQNAIDAFCESFAGDDLEMGEFETRLEMAHRAQSAEQLRLILADLPPAPVPVGNEVTDPRLAPNEVAASRANSPSISPSADLVPRPTLPEDRIPDHSVIVGIMGGAGVTVRYLGEASRDARLRLRSERKARKLLERGK